MEENIKDIIDIGDVLDVEISTIDEAPEKLRIMLVDSVKDIGDEISQISINSPFGKAIYKKTLDEDCSYKVNNITFNVKILNRVENKVLQKIL